MTAMQVIKITTKNGREFRIHLTLLSLTNFECKLAFIKGLNANSVYYPFESGESAHIAFERLISKFNIKLSNDDPDDMITELDNITNELITIDEQKRILGENVLINASGSFA